MNPFESLGGMDWGGQSSVGRMKLWILGGYPPLSSSPLARDHESVPLSEAKKAKILSESQPATSTTKLNSKSSHNKKPKSSHHQKKKKNKIGGKHVVVP